jgi:T-complex protein 1 subunit delta
MSASVSQEGGRGRAGRERRKGAARARADPTLSSLRSPVSKLGGTIDDSVLVDGLVFDQSAAKSAGGPTRVENAKIGLIQFCLSPPKTDLENSVIVSDYAAMDRVLRDERNHILGLVKRIKAAGCTVLLVQKSILRDATTDLALHYLAKAKILVVRDVERDEVELVSKALGLTPVAHIDAFTPEKLGAASLVEEARVGSGRVVRATGVARPGRTACCLLRGSNSLVLGEAARSLHDAMCAVRCLVSRPFLLPGGGAPEAACAAALAKWAKGQTGAAAVCGAAFADALEAVPYTLAENAGLVPIDVVSELRSRHAAGEAGAGVDARRGVVPDMAATGVVQPLAVTRSALTLAAECVRMILKIDDIVPTR